MEKLYKFSFQCLRIILLVLTVHWLLVSFIQLQQIWLGGIFVLLLLVGLSWFFREKIVRFYHFCMKHKWAIVALSILFQLMILLSAELLIRRDAAVVFLGAFKKISEQSISNYLTRNPNNLLLFLYERWIYNLAGDSGLWILQGINLFCTNITSFILYKGSQKHFGQKIADRVFSFYSLLIAFSPYIIATYTDMLTLPMISLQLVFALDLLKTYEKREQVTKALCLGFISAVAMAFRPTVLILVIACFTLLFFQKNWKKLVLILSCMGLSFGLLYTGIKYIENNQQEVQIIDGEGLAKGPLLFINLGLTYSGTDQSDMKKGLLQYIDPDKRDDYNNGLFKTENVVKEIKRRLSEYTVVTFLQHLEFKEGQTVNDGTLGWLYYRDIKKEKTPYISPLYHYTRNNALAELVRDFVIYTDGPYYWLYSLAKQMIWLLLAVGLIGASLTYRFNSSWHFLQLALFGGLAFLLLFEGGKGRYLIQFIPQIILLSSLGLDQLTQYIKRRV